jgi:hypothetical protein
MKTIILSYFLFFILNIGSSQENPNEKLVYVASYNMNGLMTTMAEVVIETELVKTAKSSYLHTGVSAKTFSKWDTYFKVRDVYDAYMNPITLKPRLYKRSVSEGAYTKKEKYVFSTDGKKITTTTIKNSKPEVKNTVTIGANTVDIVSLITKMRALDFQKIKVGSIKTYTIVFDEKEFSVAIKFMGLQTVNAGNLGAQKCYKVAIDANSDVVKGKDKNLIWFTVNKMIPALIKFSIPVGSGVLKLKTVSKIK